MKLLIPRFRLLRWSLFGLALVGLGFLLQDWLSPSPRCMIAMPAFETGALSPDGNLFVTGPRNPVPNIGFLGGGLAPPPVQCPCRTWDTHSGRVNGTYFQGQNAQYFSVSPGFHFLAVKTEAGLHLVDLASGKQRRLNFDFEPFLGSLSYSPREDFLIVSYMWSGSMVETATGKAVEIPGKDAAFQSLVTDDAAIFETEDERGSYFHFCNIRTRRTMKTLKNLQHSVVSPDGKTLAGDMMEGLIFMDLKTFDTRLFRPATGAVPQMMFSPDGKILAVFTENQGVELWDVALGKKRRGDLDQLRNWRWDIFNLNDWGPVFFYASFSPDSTLFALACNDPDDPALEVWDLTSATLLWRDNLEHARCRLAFSGDSQYLVARPKDKGAVILNPRTGDRHRVFAPNGEGTCDFTSDLRFIAIHSEISRQPHLLEKLLGDWWPGKGKSTVQQIRVAEVATGRELGRLEDDKLEAWLSDDGQTLVTKHDENGETMIRVWDLPLRPPLRLVIGIPLGLGLLVLLFSRWRARRRGRAALATVGPVTMNAEQKP